MTGRIIKWPELFGELEMVRVSGIEVTDLDGSGCSGVCVYGGGGEREI